MSLLLVSAFGFLFGTGCSDGQVVASRGSIVERIAGGGTRGEKLDRELGVAVLDARTDQPLSGAEIWIGEGASATAAGFTDGEGQLWVDEATLRNALAGQDRVAVTAAKQGYVTTSYAGIDRDRVTLAVRSTVTDPDAEATINARVLDFEARADPGAGAYWIAFGAVATDLDFLNDGLDEARLAPPPPTCRWVDNRTPCVLAFKGRPGRRTVFALIARGSDLGVPGDDTDDELQILDIAVPTEPQELTLDKTNEVPLEKLGAAKLTELTLTPGAAPGDVDSIRGVPGINRTGDVMVFPSLAASISSWVIPLSIDDFAGEVLWGVATASSSDGSRRARVVRRGVEAPATSTPVELTIPDFVGPVGVSLQSQAFVIEAPSEMSLYRLHVSRGGETVYEALLIGQTRFTPPASLLAAGAVQAEIAGLELPLDTENFSLRESYRVVTRDAAAQVQLSLP